MLKTCAVLLALLPFAALPAQAQERHLTMTGTARIEAVPDITRARGGIYIEEDSAVEALKQAERRMATLRDAVEPFGAITASRIALGQSRPKGTRLIRSDEAGFTARGTVVVTLADPGKSGEALDALAGAGIEGVAYLIYDISDLAALMKGARERAVADAVERAQTYAGAAGLTLGPIVMVSDNDAGTGQMHARENYGAHSSYGAQGAVGPEVSTIAATVTIRWLLE